MAQARAMRRFVQILFAAASFAAVFIVGIVFDEAFRQAGIQLEKRMLEGPPLPGLTKAFIGTRNLSTLLLSLPWLVLLGYPLVRPGRGKADRGADSFLVRYLAFLSIEVFLVFVLLVAILMPFIHWHMLMTGPEREWHDGIPAAVFLLGLSVLLAAAIRALVGRRNDAVDAAGDG